MAVFLASVALIRTGRHPGFHPLLVLAGCGSKPGREVQVALALALALPLAPYQQGSTISYGKSASNSAALCAGAGKRLGHASVSATLPGRTRPPDRPVRVPRAGPGGNILVRQPSRYWRNLRGELWRSGTSACQRYSYRRQTQTLGVDTSRVCASVLDPVERPCSTTLERGSFGLAARH